MNLLFSLQKTDDKKGEDSAKEKGWLSTKDIRAMVGL